MNKVDREDESAEAQKDPQNSFRPMSTVLGDVLETVQGARLAVLLDDGDAGHIGATAFVELLDTNRDGI